MLENSISFGDTVIINSSALAVVVGRNKFEGTFLVKLVHQGQTVRVKMSSCIPATQAAWVLYGNGPISNFFEILDKGYLGNE